MLSKRKRLIELSSDSNTLAELEKDREETKDEMLVEKIRNMIQNKLTELRLGDVCSSYFHSIVIRI